MNKKPYGTYIIARACFFQNEVIRKELGEPPRGDYDDMPDEYKRGLRLGIAKQRASPSRTAEESHSEKTRLRKKAGWKFADKYNLQRKEAPDIVEWSELCEDQRKKASVFIETVKAYIEVGF